jgi:hypothetical protein
MPIRYHHSLSSSFHRLTRLETFCNSKYSTFHAQQQRIAYLRVRKQYIGAEEHALARATTPIDNGNTQLGIRLLLFC